MATWPVPVLRPLYMAVTMGETAVQAECKALYRAVGCLIWDTSQKRRALITPGLPDLLVFHLGKRAFFFHEIKATAPQSAEQRRFEQTCETCGITYLLGGVDVARDYLRRLGILR